MHQRWRHSFALSLLALLTLPLTEALRAQSLEAGAPLPPWRSTHDVPRDLRGIPKHGMYIAGGVGCGLRPPEWGRRYREIVEATAYRRAEKPSDAAVTMRAVEGFEDYARQAIRHDRRGFCSSVLRQEVESGDWIVQGRGEPG